MSIFLLKTEPVEAVPMLNTTAVPRWLIDLQGLRGNWRAIREGLPCCEAGLVPRGRMQLRQYGASPRDIGLLFRSAQE